MHKVNVCAEKERKNLSKKLFCILRIVNCCGASLHHAGNSLRSDINITDGVLRLSVQSAFLHSASLNVNKVWQQSLVIDATPKRFVSGQGLRVITGQVEHMKGP